MDRENLKNYTNYGVYAELIKNGKFTLYTKDITKDNIFNHFMNIVNIFKDGIETEYVQSLMVDIVFDTGDQIQLSLFDLYTNLIMWRIIVSIESIKPKHIFFNDRFTKDVIKNYIDKFYIIPYRKVIPNIKMNNVIDDCIKLYKYINLFDMYLANTVCLEDFINLMNEHPRVKEILHVNLENVPIEEYSKHTDDLINELMKYIINSDHCLRDSILSSQGVNPKQFKEFAVSIGSKPDGTGGIFPAVINSNYITGGLTDLVSLYIDEYIGRLAQILSKQNVGSSGDFARLLGLNNQDSFLHHDPNYICNSQNFQKVEIKNESILKRLSFRYYRLHPQGMEYNLNSFTDKHLIGRTIYLRSPMTCASSSKGEGICYRCYGDISYTNSNINIGKIAAEILSEKLTQRLLSAKHILESAIKESKWCEHFNYFFIVDGNLIAIDDDLEDISKYSLVIDIDNIISDDEYDETGYLYQFKVSDGVNLYDIYTEETDKIFLNSDLSIYISEKYHQQTTVSIPFTDLVNINLFNIILHNNEITKALEDIEKTIDNTKITPMLDRHELLQRFTDTVYLGKLDVSSVHLEVILSNQIRDIDDELELVDWTLQEPLYRIYTLKQALKKHPSITTSLSFREISRQFSDPLTYRKKRPSFMDLFFMVKPQDFLNSKEEIIPENELNRYEGLQQGIKFID